MYSVFIILQLSEREQNLTLIPFYILLLVPEMKAIGLWELQDDH